MQYACLQLCGRQSSSPPLSLSCCMCVRARVTGLCTDPIRDSERARGSEQQHTTKCQWPAGIINGTRSALSPGQVSFDLFIATKHSPFTVHRSLFTIHHSQSSPFTDLTFSHLTITIIVIYITIISASENDERERVGERGSERGDCK